MRQGHKANLKSYTEDFVYIIHLMWKENIELPLI